MRQLPRNSTAFSQARSNNGLREGKTAGENFFVVDLHRFSKIVRERGPNEEKGHGPMFFSHEAAGGRGQVGQP